MHTQAVGGISLAEFQSQYDSYLLKRGLSRQTLKLHQQVFSCGVFLQPVSSFVTSSLMISCDS